MSDTATALLALSSQGVSLLTLLALCGVRVFVMFFVLPATAGTVFQGWRATA